MVEMNEKLHDCPETDQEIKEEIQQDIVQEEHTAEAQVESGADEEHDKHTDKKKKSVFGKKPDKRDEQIKELQDKYTRQLAEFENFRKRNEAEKSRMYDIGAREVIEKLLPVVDNFERGLASVLQEDKENPFVVGMDQIYKQLMNTLEELKVEAIPALGESFNPDLHNAVMHVEDEEHPENTVIEELMKGYKYKDTVVRYSMVKVAN